MSVGHFKDFIRKHVWFVWSNLLVIYYYFTLDFFNPFFNHLEHFFVGFICKESIKKKPWTLNVNFSTLLSLTCKHHYGLCKGLQMLTNNTIINIDPGEWFSVRFSMVPEPLKEHLMQAEYQTIDYNYLPAPCGLMPQRH